MPKLSLYPLLTSLVALIARSSTEQMGSSSTAASYSASTQTALALGFSVDTFLQSSILNGNRVWTCGWSLCAHRPFSRKDRAVAHVARVHIGTKMYSCKNACGNPRWYVAQCLLSCIARLLPRLTCSWLCVAWPLLFPGITSMPM